MVPTSRHAARSREARLRPAGAAPGLSSGAGRLISVVRRPGKHRSVGRVSVIILGIGCLVAGIACVSTRRPPADQRLIGTWVYQRANSSRCSAPPPPTTFSFSENGELTATFPDGQHKLRTGTWSADHGVLVVWMRPSEECCMGKFDDPDIFSYDTEGNTLTLEEELVAQRCKMIFHASD